MHSTVKVTPGKGHSVVELGAGGDYGFVSVPDDGVGIRPEAEPLAEAYGGRIVASGTLPERGGPQFLLVHGRLTVQSAEA